MICRISPDDLYRQTQYCELSIFFKEFLYLLYTFFYFIYSTLFVQWKLVHWTLSFIIEFSAVLTFVAERKNFELLFSAGIVLAVGVLNLYISSDVVAPERVTNENANTDIR